jgi:hypothetical protein
MRLCASSFAPTLFAALAVACSSGSGNGGGAPSDVTSACYAQCSAEQNATGCQPGALTLDQCKQLCDAFIPGFTPDCQQKAKASWTCGASATWECGPGGNVPLEQGTACETQNQAYAQCSSALDGGGGG